ncbi:MAG: DUF5011 domain-containing protein [Roseburia sp.]|nr:DUF5011 domain-containing protein [Roseburia sp.]
MKKREVLATLAVMATLGVSACGAKELELTANQVEAELGSELDTAVATYVADADVAAEATVDFSAVDMTKVGTYSATVTYKDQTAGFDVVVVDTTAPEVTVADQIVAAAGEPLYAKDVITGITELGGEVEVTFSEPETVDGAETAEGTESLENTEIAEESTEEAGNTEAVDATETEEGTESAVDSTESTETAEPEAEFVIGDVICSNTYVIYPETGEYDNTLTVTDASGNSTEVSVHIVVGDAPELSGIEDITVTVGTEADEIDYLDGVTAADSNGNDITANIVCDSAAVDLEAAGEYEITYMVTDENGFTATETATVTVEEKSGKKSDSKKSDSGKTDSKTDSSKKGNSSSSGNGNAASAGTSGSSNASDASSGNNSNSNQTSSGNNTSSNAGNTSTPSADNSSNTSTPSTDTGSTTTPSVPSPAPETPSTPSADNSSSGGAMSEPDNLIPMDPSLLDNSNADNSSGADGGDVTDVGTN